MFSLWLVPWMPLTESAALSLATLCRPSYSEVVPEGQLVSADLLLLRDGQTDKYNFNSMICQEITQLYTLLGSIILYERQFIMYLLDLYMHELYSCSTYLANFQVHNGSSPEFLITMGYIYAHYNIDSNNHRKSQGVENLKLHF